MRLNAPCELRPGQAGSVTPTFHPPTPQRRRWKVLVIPLVLLAVTAFPPCASADFIFTASGSSNEGALSAEADFTIGPNGYITVALKNLQPNISSAGQAISGLSFTASGLQNPPGLSLYEYGGAEIQVNSDGSITPLGSALYSDTDPKATNTLAAGHWAASSSGSMTTLTGGKPDNMILGPPSYSGNILPSNGNNGFNPWFENSATFVLNAPGVTTDSTISNVVFTFGTNGQHSLNGSQTTATPAPSAVILLASGAICLAGFRALSRRRRQAA